MTLKTFETLRKIAEQTGLSYPTALKAVHVIRAAILNASPDAELLGGPVETDESYFGGRRKGKRGRGSAGKYRYLAPWSAMG